MQVTALVNKQTKMVTFLEFRRLSSTSTSTSSSTTASSIIAPVSISINSAVELQERYKSNDRFKQVINYVQNNYLLLNRLSPDLVHIQEYSTFIQYTAGYTS